MKTNQELREEIEKLELQKRILELEFEIKQLKEDDPFQRLRQISQRRFCREHSYLPYYPWSSY